ncbi:MAG: type II secretion system protein [Thermodesulfobacteriota bacterium]
MSPPPTAGRSSRRLGENTRGYTLIELVLTLVLLGAIATVLLPFFNAITHGADPELRARAVSLGQAMMDEILCKRWDEMSPVGGRPICTAESNSQATRPALVDACLTAATPLGSVGPEAGEARTTFDDVDDYNGLNEADTFTDQNGNAFAMAGYTRVVAVQYIASNSNPIDQDTPSAPGTTDTKLIIVTVTSPLGETFRLIGVSCNL